MICPACGHCHGIARRKLNGRQLHQAALRIASGEPLMEVARDLSVSRATLYRRLKEQREQAA